MTGRSHTTGSFTRGSQLFLHSLRMVTQGSKAAILGGLFCVLALWFFVCHQTLYISDLYYWMMGVWGGIKLDFAETFITKNCSMLWIYDFSVGFWKHIPTKTYIWKLCNGEVGYRLQQFWGWASSDGILHSIVTFVGGAFFTSLVFSWSGWKKAQNRHIRGAKIASIKALKKMMRKKEILGELNLDGLPLVKDRETSHMLIAGTTGSGKTNALHHLLPQLRSQKAVIVDLTGELTQRYFDKGQGDVLLSPSAPQSVQWNPWLDSRTLFEYRAFAESFVGEVSKQDPFWSQAASECLAAALEKLSSRQSIGELTQILTKSSLEEFCHFFQNTTAAAYADPKGERTTVSIRSTLTSKIQSLEIMAREPQGQFSFRHWMQETDKGWLFLATRADQREVLCPLISAHLSMALKALMQQFPDPKRRCWFVIDELPALNKTPALLTAATEGRKYGACLVLGIQDMAQLKAKYGIHESQTLLNQMNTKVLFRFTDPDITQMISKMLGDKEEGLMKESLSFGANTMRDGVNLNEQIVKEPIVSPTEIASLQNLECFVRLPEDLPVVKHQMSWAGSGRDH
jgi:type IV conjugative transfer system coupling protein TraD